MAGSASSERRPGEVGSITALKSQPRADEALDLLRKIASLVKPIMRKHGWHLPTLSEFFPKNPNLLGVNINGGAKICIRLRPQHDPSSFLPLEDSLIGTMLHELTHNVRGPHDDVFFKQLDALQDEYDDLRAKGYSGEGFLGDGRRVGEGIAHDKGVSVREAREKALRNFEERERVRKVLGTGGRLGGAAPDTRGKRMGDVLADVRPSSTRSARREALALIGRSLHAGCRASTARQEGVRRRRRARPPVGLEQGRPAARGPGRHQPRRARQPYRRARPHRGQRRRGRRARRRRRAERQQQRRREGQA